MSTPQTRELVFEANSSTYENSLDILNMISQSRYPVFLVFSKKSQEKFALKLFPTTNSKASTSFQHEARLANLTHSNLVDTVECQEDVSFTIDGIEGKTSYKLMEYAPHGDFFSLVDSTSLYKDEKLVRTYFRQIVEGIEYLHENEVAHLDLKLENFLLGKDFKLKITDFDMAYMTGDHCVLSRGTPNYRAPELINNTCGDPMAADIYSMGICLFILMTQYFPQMEKCTVCDFDLFSLLHGDDKRAYWNAVKLIHFNTNKRFVLSKDFQDLFWSMTRSDAKSRTTIESIKKSEWYNGPVYDEKELLNIMSKKLAEKSRASAN